MIENITTQYPEITAVVLVLLGVVLARVFAKATERLLTMFESGMHSLIPTSSMSITTQLVIRRFVYYLTLGVFLVFALRVLGIGVVTELLDVVLGVIPGLISGTAIIIVGYLAGVAVFGLLTTALGAQENPAIPRLAQVAVVVSAVLTGVAQMSVDVTFIGQVLIVVLLVTTSGLALAFALGSRDYVANLLARRYFKQFAVGDRLKIDELEGTVIDFNSSSVMLQTDAGIAVVPAIVLSNSVVIRLTA